MRWQHAKILHWRYCVAKGDKEFENAVNAINFIKQKRQNEDSNQAYKVLVAAQWDPSTA